MANPLFRESALQNLSSPEQLDQLIKITPPRAWLMLATLAFVLGAAVLWSVFGSLPSMLFGQGIIIRAGGTNNIVSSGNGVLTHFARFKPGEAVHKGQVLAHISQPLLELQRDGARAEVQRLEHDPAMRNSDALLVARSHLAELSAQLAISESVVSTHNGVVVELLASEGDVVVVNQPVLSVEQPVRSLLALIYLPPQSQGERIRPGMLVQLSPSTAPKERYGYLLGRVVSVSKYPSTERGMMNVFNSPGLVHALSHQGAPIAVEVALIADPHTKSGYRWSSDAARGLSLSSGTLAEASFTIEVRRPISLMIPLLRQTVGL
jgi:multidrug resistance efflux pump